jgi:hypothetical protein
MPLFLTLFERNLNATQALCSVIVLCLPCLVSSLKILHVLLQLAQLAC